MNCSIEPIEDLHVPDVEDSDMAQVRNRNQNRVDRNLSFE